MVEKSVNFFLWNLLLSKVKSLKKISFSGVFFHNFATELPRKNTNHHLSKYLSLKISPNICAHKFFSSPKTACPCPSQRACLLNQPSPNLVGTVMMGSLCYGLRCADRNWRVAPFIASYCQGALDTPSS